MSNKTLDQVRETMRKAEDRAKSRRRDYTRATIEHDGHSADLDSPEGEEVIAEAIKDALGIVDPGVRSDNLLPGHDGVYTEYEDGTMTLFPPSDNDALVANFATRHGPPVMPSGQAIIPGMERELLQRDSLVKAKVEELLRELDAEGAEVAVSVKIPTQTRIDYVLMDVETKISVKMKPSKESEG